MLAARPALRRRPTTSKHLGHYGSQHGLQIHSTSHELSDALKSWKCQKIWLAQKPPLPTKKQRGPSTLASHKAPKTKEGAIQLPADRNASPRETPRVRKIYRPTAHPSITPFDVAGPSTLETSTSEIFTPNSDDESDSEPDEDRLSRPLPFYTSIFGGRSRTASPTPSVPAQSPPPHSPADSTMSDPDVNMDGSGSHTGGAASIHQVIPPPNGSAANGGATNSGNGDAANNGAAGGSAANGGAAGGDAANGGAAGGDAPHNPALNPVPQPPPPFALPTVQALAAEIPAARARDPHLQYLASQATPPINTEINHAIFQHNAGQFRNQVITNTRLLSGFAPTQLTDFNDSPYHKFALNVADGGDHVLSRVQFETPLDTQIEAIFHTLAPTSVIIVRLPLPDPDADTSNKYGGPSSILAEVEDDTGAAAIAAQMAFGIHPGLAFWAHDLDANRATRVWAFGHYDMVRPNGDPADVEAKACTACILAAYTNTPIYRLVDQFTQVKGGDPRQRVFDGLNTIHFELLRNPQHPEKPPVVIGYMEPLTTNEAEQEELYSLLRRLDFYAGPATVTGPSVHTARAPTIPPSTACTQCPNSGGGARLPNSLNSPPDNPLYPGPSGGSGSNNGGGGNRGNVGGRGNGGGRGGYGRGGGGRGSPYGGGGGYGYRAGWRARGELDSETEERAVVGGDNGSATGRAFDDGHREGGDRANSRSEANRDGYQPSGEGAPRQADEERLEATPGAERAPGGARNGVNAWG
ncbi:hypothetical protein B0H11DRAFT_1920029 [Mycena galericulata]|nr:hypothetical protein B0H11DRAFT_1920029 [Mycena galericulata]